MDCDAFFAAVEKRDRPELRDRPVIVGGGRRGVVSTACYIARIHGVHSAMPMFQARKLCPEAVVVRPRMKAYAEVSGKIRGMMNDLTPAVEPLSLDEAFLDLTGTARLHGAPPSVLMARLVNRMERELGVSGSVGLSHNKFLAKVASDLDKPRGFSVIGKAETADFLADKPVGLIWGIGAVQQKQLEKVGIRKFRDLRRWSRQDLERKFGENGSRLWKLARGEDARRIAKSRRVRSMSSETTFAYDISDPKALDGYVWNLSEKVSGRLKGKRFAGRVVMLKLKRRDFRLISRRRTLAEPTLRADQIYTTASELLQNELRQAPFRLIGVGVSDLQTAAASELESEPLDPAAARRIRAEKAADSIRERFGSDAILKGRSLRQNSLSGD